MLYTRGLRGTNASKEPVSETEKVSVSNDGEFFCEHSMQWRYRSSMMSCNFRTLQRLLRWSMPWLIKSTTFFQNSNFCSCFNFLFGFQRSHIFFNLKLKYWILQLCDWLYAASCVLYCSHKSGACQWTVLFILCSAGDDVFCKALRQQGRILYIAI